MANPELKKKDEKPTSIRLGELKPILHERSMELDRSIHWLIIKILKDYFKSPSK